MSYVQRPDGHPQLQKGLTLRIALVSLATNFRGFRNTSEAWLYMRGFYQNKTLVQACLYQDGNEIISYTHEKGENTMGLLNNARNASRDLIPTIPFGDKAALAARKERFTILGIRARVSGITKRIEYKFFVEMLAPSISYSLKDESGVAITPTKPVTKMFISQESNPFRDSVVASLCGAMGIDYAAMIESALKDARDADQEEQTAKPYGPAILLRIGKAFDIADYEEPKPPTTYDPAQPF